MCGVSGLGTCRVSGLGSLKFRDLAFRVLAKPRKEGREPRFFFE